VALESGEEIRAPVVVSCIHPKIALVVCDGLNREPGGNPSNDLHLFAIVRDVRSRRGKQKGGIQGNDER